MNRWLAPLLSDSGDEHLLHRLEAFSDVVIGFCLAALTVSLSGGVNHSSPLPLNAKALESFALGFFMISLMWWFHNRLFAKFFLLNAVTIVANFGMLGALMLTIYFAQAYSSLAVSGYATKTLADQDVRYWFVSGAVVYGLLGVMYTLGLIARWKTLVAADRRFGVHRATGSWLGFAMLAILGLILTSNAHAKSVLDVAAALAVAIALSRGVIKRLIPDPPGKPASG